MNREPWIQVEVDDFTERECAMDRSLGVKDDFGEREYAIRRK
ncbi:hypothetical protein [Paenibacillus sp. SI8]